MPQKVFKWLIILETLHAVIYPMHCYQPNKTAFYPSFVFLFVYFYILSDFFFCQWCDVFFFSQIRKSKKNKNKNLPSLLFPKHCQQLFHKLWSYYLNNCSLSALPILTVKTVILKGIIYHKQIEITVHAHTFTLLCHYFLQGWVMTALCDEWIQFGVSWVKCLCFSAHGFVLSLAVSLNSCRLVKWRVSICSSRSLVRACLAQRASCVSLWFVCSVH